MSTEICLLITSGNGPGECHQAVVGVLRRLQQEADFAGLELDVSATPARHGLKSAVILLHGAEARAFADRWQGTIRWRAKSTLRPHHKRINWFVGVSELVQQANQAMAIGRHEVTFESFRAGGPGGQHQNTTDSAVRATHGPTGLVAVAREMRSQHRNKALALKRLQALMCAQAAADQEADRGSQNQLHNALERGNPIRCFKGRAFHEEGGKR
ncbi:peptide chain release factor H [uncultured Tateyamaria sp.]|uniref:peptide chain release factor H n=1 Tax=uncultured Tateyamaria sp. TaxID=455651 RepID=UPI0026174BF5|nr:peptide chain release factor H [uncultured Tateyamaria sp.]